MGCTRVEFVRWWHSFTQDKNDFAAHNQASVVVQNVVSHVVGDVTSSASRVQFTIEELDPRRLGLAVIPQLKVSIRFVNVQTGETGEQYETDAAVAWVAKFDHYTQRGGG